MAQCQLGNKKLLRSVWLETRVAHSPDNTGPVSPVAWLLFGHLRTLSSLSCPLVVRTQIALSQQHFSEELKNKTSNDPIPK